MKYTHILFPAILLTAVLFSCTNDTGNVEVTYLEATAIYGDMDAIRAIPLNKEPRSIENPGKIYISEEFVLIGEEGAGIHVVNNQDRANPSSDAFIHIPGNKEFFVSGKYLYAESYYDLLKIDISNPSLAVLMSRSKNAIQEDFINDKGETLIGFSYKEKTITLDENDDFMNEVLDDQLVYLDFAKNVIPKSSVPSSFSGNSAQSIGTLNRITKADNHIYVVSNNNMIILEDNEDGFSNNIVRLENVKEEMETVFPFQNNLFVGSKTSMSIFDISNGNHPIERYEFEHATSCDPVLPYSDLAFITLRTADFSLCPGNINALLTIDISDLSNPIQISETQLASPYGMSVINDKLYVGNGENGLSIFDVSQPKNPILIQTNNDIVAYDIIADPANSDYIFVAGLNGMNQYKIGEDLSLQWTSNIDY
jgi:hypothetical protein